MVIEMKFCPFKSVNEIAFNSSKDEIIQKLGSPDDVSTNSRGWYELVYSESVYRLDKEGRLVEVTVNLESIEINGATVQYHLLKDHLSKYDNETFDTIGFIVSPKFGIAFDPEHKFWITHFRQTELEGWRNVSG